MTLERIAARGLSVRLFPPGSPRYLELIRACWPLAVGPELARRTEVLALEGVTLRVRVPDAGWRKVLHRMRVEILRRLRALAGEASPQRMGFTDGPAAGDIVSAPRVPLSCPAAVAPTAPPALEREATAIADAELRRLFLATAGRYLARARARPATPEDDHE